MAVIPSPGHQQQLLRRDGQADARVGVEAGVAALHLAATAADSDASSVG